MIPGSQNTKTSISTTKNFGLRWQKGTEVYGFQENSGHYRVNVFLASLNLAISELEAGFFKKNLTIFCAITDVVMSSKPSQESLLAVGEHFTITSCA